MSKYNEDQKKIIQIVKDISNARNLKPRDGQKTMISTVSQSFFDVMDGKPKQEGHHISLIEAPTGTGKSFGYSIPLSYLASKEKLKLVLATAVVSLQEQLVNKDLPNILPFIEKYVGRKIKVSIAKGRNRFVCVNKLNSVCRSNNKSIDKNVMDNIKDLHKQFPGKWTGDYDSIGFSDIDKQKIWPLVTVDKNQCMKKHCFNYSKCPYYNQKKDWEDADILVANHDLVIANIQSDGKVLTPHDKTIYVIDEAHNFPDKLISSFETSFQVSNILDINKKITTFLKKMNGSIDIGTIISNITRIDDNLKKINKECDLLPWEKKEYQFIVTSYDLSDDVLKYLNAIKSDASTVEKSLSKIKEVIEAGVKNEKIFMADDDEFHHVVSQLGTFVSKYETLNETLSLFTKVNNEKYFPVAKWIDKNNDEYKINACVTNAAISLKSFFEQAKQVVFTSATLSTLGKIDNFKKKLGIDYYKSAKYVSLKSPFNHKENAEFVLGNLGVNILDYNAHTGALIKYLPRIIKHFKQKGVLILFTSKKQLDEVYKNLDKKTKNKCKVQYTEPNRVLLQKHEEDIKSGKESYLLGSTSFSEGLDLPGDLCSLVIITKIPFPMHDNPMYHTLDVYYKKLKMNTFRELSLPDAGEKFNQEVGRLIRTESDKGIVLLLDSRIEEKYNVYGKDLLKSIPDMKRSKLNILEIKE